MELLSPIVNVNDLINKGYVDKKFLAGLKVSGNSLAYTLNGTDYLLTVPYATNAAQLGGIASGYYTYYQRLVFGQYNRLFSFEFNSGEKGNIVFRVVSSDNNSRNTAIYSIHWNYTASIDGIAIAIKCVYSEGGIDRRAAISAVKRTTSLDGSTTIVGYDIFYNAGRSALNGTYEILSYPTTITFLTRTPILATADDIANAAYTSEGGVLYSGTFVGSLSGKSTYSDYVRITDTEPTSLTSYYVPFVSGTTAGTNYVLRANEGFVYRTLEGTAGAVGNSILILGNSVAAGTAGNKQGGVRFYSTSTGYTQLNGKATTNNNVLVLPLGTGTLVYHTTDTAIGSSTLPVYVNSKGEVTACTYPCLGMSKIAASTDVGTLTESLLYWTDTDGNSSNLTNSAFTSSHAMLQVANHIYGTDYRRARIAFDGYGVLKTFNDRGTTGEGGIWYTVLTTNNFTTHLNDTYVRKAGDTMTGRLTLPYLTITDTAASAHILFSRASYNYICAPINGIIAIMPNNGGQSSATGYYFDGTKLYAGTTNSKALGSSTYRWSNVYSVQGNFSGQITSSVATGTAPFVVASTTEVSNLNADLLDGYHSSGFVHSSADGRIVQYDEAEWIKFFIFTHTSTALDSAVVIDFYNVETGAAHAFGRLLINARGTALRSADIVNWGSEYIPEIRVTSDDGLTFALWMNAQKTSYHPYMKTVLFNQNGITSYYWVREVSDNEPTGTNTNYTVVRTGLSAKATTLYTTRTLWGQSFNGSANVSGSLTGVGNITGSGAMAIATTGASNLAFRYNNADATSLILNGTAFKPYDAATGAINLGTTAARWKGIYGQTLNLSGDIFLANSKHIYAKDTSGNNISSVTFGSDNTFRFGYGAATKGYNTVLIGNRVYLQYGSAATTGLLLNESGNVGIGTASPAYKLDVNGSFRASSNATIGGSLTTGSHILPSTHGGASIGQTAQRWAAGYFTTAVNIGAANSSAQGGTANTTIGAGRIELSYSAPYIDFHYNNSTSDYTNRIIEGLSGQLTVTGKLRVGLASGTSTDYNFHVAGTAYASTSLTTPTGNITTVNATTLRRIQSAASTVPTIWVSSGNYDNTVLRVDYSKNTNYYGDYGFTLKYMGTGGGYQNNLNLYADNTTVATQNIAWSVNQLGQVAIRTAATNTSYDLYVNSTAYIPTLTVTEMKIGDATITWDSTNNALKIDKSVYSTGGVSALGYSETTSDGNGSGIVSTVLSEYNLINTTLTEDVTVVASAYATKRIYNSVKTNTTNISTLQTNYSAMSTTVNNHASYIDALNNSQFYSSGDASTGLTLTWFTASGGGRSVTIPTWNSLGQTWNTYDNTPCLISSWLFDDINDMINTYAVTGIGTSGNYLTYTKNGTTTNVTVPYASYSGYSNSVKSTVPTSTAAAYATGYLKSYYADGNNTVTNKPTGVDAFGMISMQTASGYTGQILISANTNVDMYWKTGASGSLASVSWKKLLDDSNTSFTQTLTSGTKIGEIKIGGASTNIYAPASTAAVTVVNNLTSTSTTSALSANQGRVLKNSITDIESALSTLGTSSQLDYTSSITSGSTNLVTSGGVYSYVTSNYLPLSGGTITGSLSIEGSSNGISLYDSSGNENVLILGSGGISCSTVNGYTLAAACAKGVSDSSSASALSSSDTNLATVRDIYYGTPKINNSKGYTSSTTIYAPTAGGTAGYYLKGAGTTTAPTWQAYSTTPTSGSTTLITSGAVYTALANQKVSVSQTLTSGTEIGSITVGSTSTTLYAPASSDSSSSSVDFTSIASNVVPSADITYNLGTGTKRWNYLYARYLRSYSSISPVYDTGATLGSASTRFSCIYSQSATFGDYMDVDNQVAYTVGFYNNDLYGYDDVQDEVWNISSYGYAQFMSVVDTSDQTKKNILGNTSLTLSQIANAPSVYFTWKNNKNTARQAGTLAQYWKSVLPEVVTGEEGNMGLMYGQTAVISAITIAKETETIKQRVDRLEAENKVLRDEIEELKNQLNSL